MNQAPQVNPMAELVQHKDSDSVEIALLRQWMRWWASTDEAPAKMPDALHVRTAIFLTKNDVGTGDLS